MTAQFTPVESIPVVRRKGAGKRSMYPGLVRTLAETPGQAFDLGAFPKPTANMRARNLKKVPVVGGKVIATTRCIDGEYHVFAQFERVGRKPVEVAGERLTSEA